MDNNKLSNLLINFYYEIQKQSFWDDLNELLKNSNLKYKKLTIEQKIDIASKTLISRISENKIFKSFGELSRSIFPFPIQTDKKYSDFEIFLLLIKRIQLINLYGIQLNENKPSDSYSDPVDYTEVETGKYYSMEIKKSNKKKIIAECIFRTFKRNDRLPEYLSGLLCTINNFKELYGEEWGYRLYLDKSLLKKNVFVKNNNNNNITKTNYDYSTEFEDQEEIKKWVNLFENRDEGEMFHNLLKQLNKLDYVEIIKVELSGEFMNENGYPYGLLATNYRFHASLDKSKELVYMKDVDYVPSEITISDWKKFEKSDKSIIYYFMPEYKPPTHALVQYPFTIIAYFWGIKPQNINLHYNFDSILEYFLNFDDSDKNFSLRKKSLSLNDKGYYGSDEIILTDLIFSGFKVKDTKPISQSYYFNNLILFYIIYYLLINDTKTNSEFENILTNNLLKSKVNINKLNTEQIKQLSEWDFNDYNNFIFGNDKNKFCCLLPGLKNINSEEQYKYVLYYIAYNNTIYDMVENNNLCEMNFRDTFYNKLTNYMCYYDTILLSKLTINDINETIFNLVFTTQVGWSPIESYKKIILPNDQKYIFGKYLTQSSHIQNFFDESKYQDEPILSFITNTIEEVRKYNNIVISNLIEIYYNENKEKPREMFVKTLWGCNSKKNYDKCVANKKVSTLVGGYLFGVSNTCNKSGFYGSYNPYIYGYNNSTGSFNNFNRKIDCENGEPSIIKNINPRYNWYQDQYKPLIDGTNKIIDDNYAKHNDNIIYFNENKYIYQQNTDLIEKIKELMVSSIVDNESNFNLVKLLNSVTLDPKFASITWKLLNCVAQIRNQFVLMSSGNTLCYKEYGYGQYPWDDDIDIAYHTDEEYNEYFNLLKECFKQKYDIYFYMKQDQSDITSSDKFENILTEKLNDPKELGSKFRKENFWFGKITFNVNEYFKLAKKIGMNNLNKFGGRYISTPWIDVFPLVLKDNIYYHKFPNQLRLNENFNIESKRIKLFGTEIIETDDVQKSIDKYKKPELFNKQAVIYNHVSQKKIDNIVKYDNQDKQDFVKNYVKVYNELMEKYIKTINCDEFCANSESETNYKMKYLKYKQKYLNQKYN
jgi:hypothetical protein